MEIPTCSFGWIDVNNDVYYLLNFSDDSMLDVIGNIMAFPHGDRAIDNNMQVDLNAGANITGPDIMNL